MESKKKKVNIFSLYYYFIRKQCFECERTRRNRRYLRQKIYIYILDSLLTN